MLSKALLLAAAALAATAAVAQPTTLGAPAGVSSGTSGAPFNSTPTPIGGGTLPNTVVAPGTATTLPGSGSAMTGSSAGVAPSTTTFGSTTVTPAPGTTAPSQASRGVLGPAPVSPGVVSGNSPFPCVIGSATNPC